MSDILRVNLDDAPQSAIDALDPRTRLVGALTFVVCMVALQSIPALLLGAGVALGLIWLASASPGGLGHRILHVEGFILLLLLFLPFTVPGHARFTVGPLTATDEGLLRAVTLVIRINACVLGIYALLGSLEPVRLGRAMARLGLPLPLAHLFLFAVRYVGVFRAETTRLTDSMRARAFTPRSNWHTWRSFGTLAGMILVRSFERAERVQDAMRCRAYSGRIPLTQSEAFTRQDTGFGGALAFVLLALIVVDRLL